MLRTKDFVNENEWIARNTFNARVRTRTSKVGNKDNKMTEIESFCITQIKRNKTYWSSRRSINKNKTVLLKKQDNKQKDYLELMEKVSGLKRSCTPFIVNLAP